MATPRNNSYSVASGAGVFAGIPNPPTWVKSLVPMVLGEIAGTAILNASARQSQFVGEQGVINGWGAWAKDGNKAYLSGGGHSDGWDNSVYGIDFAASAPAWTRTAAGSASGDVVSHHLVGGQSIRAYYNLDNRPAAAHLYHWAQIVNGKCVRWSYFQDFGTTLSSAMPINPNGEVWTNILDIATGTWSLGPISPSWVTGDPQAGGNPAGRFAVSWQGKHYAIWQVRQYAPGDGSTRLASYAPGDSSFTAIGADGGALSNNIGYGGCLLDTLRGQMVIVYEKTAQLETVDLTTGVRTVRNLTNVASGYASGWDSTYLGTCYDSRRDLYYVYAGQVGTGKKLYQIDPANGYAMAVVADLTSAATTVPAGLNSRMAYLADYDCIVWQPTASSNIHALRLS